jgi:hypothetical protein
MDPDPGRTQNNEVGESSAGIYADSDHRLLAGDTKPTTSAAWKQYMFHTLQDFDGSGEK